MAENNQKMIFSFETPLKQAEQLDEQQDYLFVLAQCLENPDYYRYVKNSDKMKILDNGANEQDAVSGSKLMSFAESINANIVVIPDKQFDQNTSMNYLFEFYSRYLSNKEIVDRFDFMVVPQSNTYNGMVWYFDLLLSISRIVKSVDYIGLQFKFLRKYGLEFADYAIRKMKDYNIKPHFLGFASKEQLWYNNVVSMDTSLPINFAAVGEKLTFDRLPKGINVWTDTVDVDLAIENMKAFKAMSKYSIPERKHYIH